MSESQSPSNTPAVTWPEFRNLVAKNWGAQKQTDPFWTTRWLLRTWTPYLSYVLVRFGSLTANGVTAISAGFFIVGSLMLALPWHAAWVVGAGFVLFYHALDQVDGEVARYYRRTGPATSGGHDGYFWDTAVHGVTPLMAGCIAFRLYLDSGLGILPLVPLAIDLAVSRHPWSLYCESLVDYMKGVRSKGGDLEVEVRWLTYGESFSYSLSEAKSSFSLRGAAVALQQTIMFPGYFYTLVVAAVLDVTAGPILVLGDGAEVRWLLAWLAIFAAGRLLAWVRGFRNLAAKLRSIS